MTKPVIGFANKVSLLDVVVIGVGSAIGISIFSVLAPVAGIAGSYGVIALCLAAIPMALFSFVYAFMTSAVPVSGASYLWPTRFVSPFAGFLIAWLRILGSTGAIVQHGVILVQYVLGATGWQPPTKLSMFLLFTAFYGLNVLGLSVAARVQLLLTAALVFLLLTIALPGLPHLGAAAILPTTGGGWSSTLAAVPLLVGLFIGVEFAAEIGDEVKDARRAIALGLAISGVTVIAIYLAVTISAFGVLGPMKLAASSAPILDLARATLGTWAVPVVAVAAFSAITASLNGTIIIFSRFLYAMARSGALPIPLDRLHPRFGTPHRALTAVYLLSLLGILLPGSLVFLFLAVNIPTMLKYAANCASAMMVVRRHPGLYRDAAFRPPRTMILLAASLGILCAGLVVLAGLEAALAPYALLAGWAVVGTIVWFITPKRSTASVEPTL